ncbi:MAG: hypothetical protein ACSHXD_18985 [Marinosulfonomonas sp.]
MARWIYRIAFAAISLVVVLIAVGWMVLTVPFFSSFRQGIVAEVLSEQLGYPVEVLGDVNVAPRRISKIFAADVRIMSDNIDDVV